MFTHDDGTMTIKYLNAVGYKGTYTDKTSLDHTVYVVLHHSPTFGITGKENPNVDPSPIFDLTQTFP